MYLITLNCGRPTNDEHPIPIVVQHQHTPMHSFFGGGIRKRGTTTTRFVHWYRRRSIQLKSTWILKKGHLVQGPSAPRVSRPSTIDVLLTSLNNRNKRYVDAVAQRCDFVGESHLNLFIWLEAAIAGIYMVIMVQRPREIGQLAGPTIINTGKFRYHSMDN